MYCARISGATFTADFSASEILLTQCSFGPWRRRSSKAPRTRGPFRIILKTRPHCLTLDEYCRNGPVDNLRDVWKYEFLLSDVEISERSNSSCPLAIVEPFAEPNAPIHNLVGSDFFSDRGCVFHVSITNAPWSRAGKIAVRRLRETLIPQQLR